MRGIPYQSLKGPSRPVSQSGMAAILARNSKINGRSAAQAGEQGTPVASDTPVRPKNPQSQDGEAVRSEPAAALEWQDPVKMGPGCASQHSVDFRYRIDAVKSQLSIGFTAWSIRTSPQGLNERLGCYPSGIEARAACEAHAKS